jgi:RNA recognition motif-containing protein
LRCEWAEAKHEADLALVKSLHISNLPEDCTDAQLKQLFEDMAPGVERIAMLDDRKGRDDGQRRNFAFVHYRKRSDALRALEVCSERLRRNILQLLCCCLSCLN